MRQEQPDLYNNAKKNPAWHEHYGAVWRASASLRGFPPHQNAGHAEAGRGFSSAATPWAGRWLESGWIATFAGRPRGQFGPWVSPCTLDKQNQTLSELPHATLEWP